VEEGSQAQARSAQRLDCNLVSGPRAESARRCYGHPVTPIAWDTPVLILTAEAGQAFKFECPAGGSEHSIWGTDIYTADSSICTAAVHVGRITFERGGAVAIELRPGQSSYQGTLRNGVKSNEYGPYGRSFVVR